MVVIESTNAARNIMNTFLSNKELDQEIAKLGFHNEGNGFVFIGCAEINVNSYTRKMLLQLRELARSSLNTDPHFYNYSVDMLDLIPNNHIGL